MTQKQTFKYYSTVGAATESLLDDEPGIQIKMMDDEPLILITTIDQQIQHQTTYKTYKQFSTL